MNLFKYIFRLSLVVVVSGLMVLSARAQQNNSMYYMQSLPQSMMLNPAIQPKCGFFLGLPSFEINGGNSAIGFNDIFVNDPANNRMFWFLKDQKSRANFLEKFKNDDNISAEALADYLSLGFRSGKSYFSFSAGDRFEAQGYIPYDLADLAVNGNIDASGQRKSLDLSNLGVNGSYYHQYAIGYSRIFSDKLTLGIRAKALFGIANVRTNSSDIRLQNGTDSYTTRSTIDLNTSIPLLKVSEGADGNVDSLDFEDGNMRRVMLSTKNMGFGLDLGAVCKVTDKISVSASLLDIGFIRWKNNLHNFKQDASYDFNGVNFALKDSTDQMQAILDTLKNTFTYTSNSSPYSTWLHGKLYAGVFFQPFKMVGLGLLTRQQFINKNLHSQYTLSLNLYPANALNFTFSYTIADHMYDNFGIGLMFKLLPLQFYIMSERIPLFWDRNRGDGVPYVPAYAKNVNLRAGFNLAFGYKHKEKKEKKDKPLLE